MPEATRVDINPLLLILSEDMRMYSELFNRLSKIKWREMYGSDEAIEELNVIRSMLELPVKKPIDGLEFTRLVGECGKRIMQETGKIRREVTKVIESIAKETLEFGMEKKDIEGRLEI